MKRKIWYSLIALLGLHLMGCDKIQEGYMDDSQISYTPDSLVIKAELDEIEDADRIKFQIPYTSGGIDGIDGTPPITYIIKRIDSDNGFKAAEKYISVKANGAYEVTYNHQMPRGIYPISLYIKNVHGVLEKDSIFRIIVK